MVGPLLLLKLMHCKKKCQAHSPKKRNIRPKITDASSFKETYHVKKEPDSSSRTCRICLKEGFISIFDKINSENISEALVLFGGIEIDKNDAYPKHLCSSCHAMLQSAILFRKNAQKSDKILKKSAEFKQGEDCDGIFSGTELDNDVFNFYIPIENHDGIDCQNPIEKHKYSCKKCCMEFKTHKEYHKHRMSNEHQSRRRTCPICHKSFTVLYYGKHMQLHNLQPPSFMCDICGKTFTVHSRFARHRLTHFYELPFKCSQCPYRGRFRESLKLHMRSHTGEKPYKCSECSACFICKSNLNKHMRTHVRVCNYKCEICGRGFYTKKPLEMHLKVDHTGAKEHICDICGKEFGYRKQMMKHQLKVHKRQKLRSGRLPLYLQVEMKENEECVT